MLEPIWLAVNADVFREIRDSRNSETPISRYFLIGSKKKVDFKKGLVR
ncbi:hypothetical protein [Saccharolobus solfataricus]